MAGTGQEKATFGGGCFWCMCAPFEILDGVLEVTAGYMGGKSEKPSYEEVYTDTTGHVEVVQITYDPELITYEDLLKIYWQQVDPTDGEGQFADRGTRYRPVIFCHSDKQQFLAEVSLKDLKESGRFDGPIAVTVEKASQFWEAEEYHQKYHEKHPEKYKTERIDSGRDEFLSTMWGRTCSRRIR